ncbi:hypothetical protein STEG23_016968 [Scotinomys teguina]
MQPDRATNNGSRTMEVVAAAPRCQLLLIVLMTAMLLPGMKVSPLLVWRKIASTIKLQENIGKGRPDNGRKRKWPRAMRKRRDASPPYGEDVELPVFEAFEDYLSN